MKWWNRGGSDGFSASTSISQDVHIVKSDRYQTQIVITRAASSEGSRVGSNSDEESIGEDTNYTGSTKRLVNIKRTLLYAGISTCLFAIVIIILSVGVAMDLFQAIPEAATGSASVSNNNRTSSDDEERAERLYEYLITVGANGSAEFNDPVSPESQALAWMQYKDPLNLDPNESENRYRVDQRFALLTLWFQSDHDWFGQNNWLRGDECTWEGVKCVTVSPEQNRTLSDEGDGVVSELYLARNNLQGNLPSNLHLLKSLTSLNLSGNRINGEIPKTFSSMIRLEELHLHDNFLSQGVSLDFSRMSSLIDVNLSDNQLEGTIPASLLTVASITRIRLDNNKFTGGISEDIGNLVNLCKRSIGIQIAIDDYSDPKENDCSLHFFLFVLNHCADTFTAGGNQLHGNISSLSKIRNLIFLLLGDNNFTGEVNFAGMSNLKELVLENNKFSGPLPDLSDSPSIQILRLGGNSFDNIFFPTNYLEMSNMTNFGLNDLYLIGEIPVGIGTLTNLEILNLEGNSLNGVIPLSLTVVSNLRELTAHNNELSGTIPFEISYLTNLEKLTLSSNQLQSIIPVAIGRLTSLKTLTMASNLLNGQALTSIESLSNLEVLDFSGNTFTGTVPDSFWELTSLRTVILADNYFSGTIPSSIDNLKLMQVLNVASNAFRGRIPESITSLTHLEVLDLSFNFFGGSIPNNVGNLVDLRELLLGTNYDESNAFFGLDGTIPASIANMLKLEKLEINRNRISGFLPSQHKFLESIQVYDVSENEKLGGTIPKDFSDMTQLNGLNIFGTNIDGIVPIDFCDRNVTIHVDCGGATTMECSCCLCYV
jgi:Leucine-rich repeat (LRR) protein